MHQGVLISFGALWLAHREAFDRENRRTDVFFKCSLDVSLLNLPC
jgi:hypothetical protein